MASIDNRLIIKYVSVYSMSYSFTPVWVTEGEGINKYKVSCKCAVLLIFYLLYDSPSITWVLSFEFNSEAHFIQSCQMYCTMKILQA